MLAREFEAEAALHRRDEVQVRLLFENAFDEPEVQILILNVKDRAWPGDPSAGRSPAGGRFRFA